MKKLIYCVTLLLILISIVSCGSKAPSAGSNSANNTNNAITYSKELTYLPTYHDVKSTAFTPASAAQPLSKATYIIPNTTDTKVFNDYEAIFKKDGWTITQEEKVVSFSAKKQDHVANISIAIIENNVRVIVQSK
jgi:predicted small lipoprotein YifL